MYCVLPFLFIENFTFHPILTVNTYCQLNDLVFNHIKKLCFCCLAKAKRSLLLAFLSDTSILQTRSHSSKLLWANWLIRQNKQPHQVVPLEAGLFPPGLGRKSFAEHQTKIMRLPSRRTYQWNAKSRASFLYCFSFVLIYIYGEGQVLWTVFQQILATKGSRDFYVTKLSQNPHHVILSICFGILTSVHLYDSYSVNVKIQSGLNIESLNNAY